MDSNELVKRLRAHSNQAAVEGMTRFGINPKNTLGVSIPFIRKLAREAGRDHQLARQLWASGIHEARILATMVDDPRQVTETQMERWVKDFDSWDICDQCCSNLFDKSPLAYQKVHAWTSKNAEFVKRAGFVLMATLAVHDKKASDSQFQRFLPTIERESTDDRNFVKKAVNWALRQIGKRNLALNRLALKTAKQIQRKNSPAGRWVASDAIRELTSDNVRRKLKKSR
jgi:3-methyladenine DNA glycosylase AlkD